MINLKKTEKTIAIGSLFFLFIDLISHFHPPKYQKNIRNTIVLNEHYESARDQSLLLYRLHLCRAGLKSYFGWQRQLITINR